MVFGEGRCLRDDVVSPAVEGYSLENVERLM